MHLQEGSRSREVYLGAEATRLENPQAGRRRYGVAEGMEVSGPFALN